MIPPCTGCFDCQYRTLGMFEHNASNATAAFDALGRLLSLPTGITLSHEDIVGDRVMVICTGQVRLSFVSKGRRVLHLRTGLPDDVQDMSAAQSGYPLDVTEVTAETLAPTAVRMIPRTELLEFLKLHGMADEQAAQSLSKVPICFLGCSEAGWVRICSWAACESSERVARPVMPQALDFSAVAGKSA